MYIGSNAIFCGGCNRWVHMQCSDIKGPLRLVILRSVAPDAWGLLGLLTKETIQRLRLETKSLKLSQSSATVWTCVLQEVAASWLRSHAANVDGASPANCFLF